MANVPENRIRNRLFLAVILLALGAALFLSGCIGGEERIQTPAIPNIIIGVDS